MLIIPIVLARNGAGSGKLNFSGTHLSYYLPLYDRDRDGRWVLF